MWTIERRSSEILKSAERSPRRRYLSLGKIHIGCSQGCVMKATRDYCNEVGVARGASVSLRA